MGPHIALSHGSDMKGKTRTLIRSEAATLYLKERKEGYLKEDRQVVFHEQAREASALERPGSAAIKAHTGRQRFTASIVSIREYPVVAEMERLLVDTSPSWRGSIRLQGGRVMSGGPTQAIRPTRTQSSMVLLFPYKQANRLERHEEATKVVCNSTHNLSVSAGTR
jgi:hypothetical protein